MLDEVDLKLKLSKKAWRACKDELSLRLGELQRAAREAKIPVIVLVKGWDGAGKGELINDLILPLDPRGFKVECVGPATPSERRFPHLWRFWRVTPERGRMSIFDQGWYHPVLDDRVSGDVQGEAVERAFQHILNFERQLADDGTVIIKVFLHISAEEQEHRFNKWLAKDATAWRVSDRDRRRQKDRDKYLEAYEAMLARTDTDHAPWTVIPAHDQQYAAKTLIETVANALEARLKRLDAPTPPSPPRLPSVEMVDPDTRPALPPIERKEYKKRSSKNRKKLFDLSHHLWLERKPVCIVYEGCDAAGKGGNIKRLVRALDPRGYEVAPFAAPNSVELAHHYLWRFWTRLPKSGHLTIFDRSWYGRVLVERVEGYATETEWKRAYAEINEFERTLVESGVVLLKFWLHIDQDEQLARFTARQEIEHKQWKITPDDWRNRQKWPAYRDAIAEMLVRTDDVPWHFINTNCKRRARIEVQDIVIDTVKHALKQHKD